MVILSSCPKKGIWGPARIEEESCFSQSPARFSAELILTERLKHALDRKLLCEQAGFRKDKSCTDHIAALRIIIDQATEWQTPLYMNFIDFERAFDSVHRNVIWQLMGHYGVPPQFIKLIQELYEASSCQVIHNGKLSEPFEMNTGVRQGCLLSPMIFIMVFD